MPESLTPDQLAAIIRRPGSGYYADAVAVVCTDCGTAAEADYLVPEDSTPQARAALARVHLTRDRGWTRDANGDLCPICTDTRRETA